MPPQSRMPKMTPWSSAGASSLGDMRNMGMVSRLTTIQTVYTAGRAFSVPSSRPPVKSGEAFKIPGYLTGKTALGHSRGQQFGRHHGRQGQGHDSGNGHRTGQGEGELPEQGTGQPTLQADGCIDRRQG